jgi:hypothetical protein
MRGQRTVSAPIQVFDILRNLGGVFEYFLQTIFPGYSSRLSGILPAGASMLPGTQSLITDLDLQPHLVGGFISGDIPLQKTVQPGNHRAKRRAHPRRPGRRVAGSAPPGGGVCWLFVS